MPSCAAWGQTSLISTAWDLKKLVEKVLGHCKTSNLDKNERRRTNKQEL